MTFSQGSARMRTDPAGRPDPWRVPIIPMRRRRWIVWLIVGLGLLSQRTARAGGGSVHASDQGPVHASDQRPRPAVPAGLPRYDIDAWLDLDQRRVSARERVRFTNRSGVAATELVFHVYPRYRVQDQDRVTLSKTLEVLRLSPEEAMDTQGHRMVVSAVRVGGPGGQLRVRPRHRHRDDRPARSRGGAGAVSRRRDRLHARAARLLGAVGAPSRDHVSAELVSGPGASRRARLGADPVRPLASALVSGGGALRGPVRPARGPGGGLVGADHRAPGLGAGPTARDDRGEPVARLRAGLLRPVRGPRTPRRRDAGPGGRVPRAPGQRRAGPGLRRRGPAALRALVRPLLRRRVRDLDLVLRLERQRVLGTGAARRPGDAAADGGRALPRPPGHARDLPPVVLERRRDRRLRRDVHGRGARQRHHRPPARRQVRPERPADRLAAGPGLAADDRPRGPPAGGLLRLAGARQRRAR